MASDFPCRRFSNAASRSGNGRRRMAISSLTISRLPTSTMQWQTMHDGGGSLSRKMQCRLRSAGGKTTCRRQPGISKWNAQWRSDEKGSATRRLWYCFNWVVSSRGRRRLGFGFGLLRHRAGVAPLRLHIAIDEFDHGNRRGIAVAKACLEHASISALAILVARGEHLKQFLDHVDV